MKKHAKLSASSSERWKECPGSVELCELAPPKGDTVWTIEGTNAHSLLEYCLKHPPAVARYYIGREKECGFKFKITEEMAEHVQDCVDYVRNICNRLGGEKAVDIRIEQTVSLPHIHPDLGGTGDIVIVQPFGEVHVIDFKYGAGVAVEVKDNSQLLIYGLGAVLGEDYSLLTLHIFQPRAEHVDGPGRAWEVPADYLPRFSKELKAAAVKATSGLKVYNEGDWCRWCGGAALCPALQKKALEVARTDFKDEEPKLPEVAKLTHQQIERVIFYRKSIEKWFDAVEEHAYLSLMKGDDIEGLKLVRGRSRREWVDEKIAEGVFGSRTVPLSPAQAEKKFGKDKVKNYVQTIEGSLQVAPASDRRVEIKAADKDFSRVEEMSADDF